YAEKCAKIDDIKIIKLTKKNYIDITQDYSLASLCMRKGCTVLHHTGFEYTTKNIDRLLTMRHAGQMARKAGHRTKGPKAFTQADKDKFVSALKKHLE